MEQDHYKTLGVNRGATKEEIKTAFRKSALEFHPDRHARSSAAVRDSAAAKFKKASEAYETLVDERKRADYDFRWRNRNSYTNRSTSSGSGSRSRSGSGSGSGSGFGSGSGSGSGSYYHYERTKYRSGGGSSSSEFYWSSSARSKGFGFWSQLFGTRGFLLGVGGAGILLGSALFIENVIEDAWTRNNSGKSFEDVMEGLKKAKTQNDGDP